MVNPKERKRDLNKRKITEKLTKNKSWQNALKKI